MGNNSGLIAFHTDPQVGIESFVDTGKELEVYKLKDQFYEISKNKMEENMKYLFSNIDHYKIPITLEKWRVSSTDKHLNQHAVDQLMENLASIISLKNKV